MTNKERVNRNIGLVFDLLNQIVNEPELIDNIPDHSIIEFINKDYPETEKSAITKPDKYLKVNRTFDII